jgi:hypothetical protein
MACYGLVLALAGAQPDATSSLARRAETNYVEARMRVQNAAYDAEAAWQFGRACFDWAEFARDDQREGIANEGIAACRQLIARSPSSAPGHYYLGMNLGQLARTKTLGALKLVDEMEREFMAARALDAKFDHAGPDRNLGLLYFEAPGWPVSIGDKSKAREHLQRAVEIRGDYPENRLCLLEAFVKWKETRNLQREIKTWKESLPAAREKFAGSEWEASWLDWERRWKTIREKIGDKGEPADAKAVRRTASQAKESKEISKTEGKTAATRPDDSGSGKVASVNPTLRFVVMDFPLQRMPALDQRLNVYRSGQKVGEVKVTGPSLDTTIAGDILTGEAQIGDVVSAD